MDAGDAQHLETLLRAFDEVLEYHERAGNGETEVVIALRAKRGELQERLTGQVHRSRAAPVMEAVGEASQDVPARSIYQDGDT